MITIILVIIILPYPFQEVQNTFEIYFIDVGQGDSCLIVTPENKKILIDRRRQ